MRIAISFLLYGWLVLLVALVMNGVAHWLGILTWYDYVMRVSEYGMRGATAALSFGELLFLYLLYPGILGGLVYVLVRFSG